MMRTYAGHSTAKQSNELYRGNLAKGQTGLSVAFDLPTQTGYDADHELARGEVGKVGVPVAHKGDMHALMDGIPLDRMNTSMTINATAAWLLALYIVVAEENGIDASVLAGTTQNDIIKEYLSRGTYAFPPAPSMRLIGDMVAYTIDEVPKWNPINVCSYHLQEAGATPVQEIAFAMATAQAVLDEVRPRVGQDKMGAVFGRISFFVNAGVRFVEEHAKLRAMSVLWEELGRERYGVEDPKHLRFRYGVQVNSLGLTESQPENNVQRIVLEALAVTMGRNARARAIQLPAWNEALGLPRPWDQQWSLRIQQVLAYETDLLEYPDIFEGSVVMDGLVAELLERRARGDRAGRGAGRGGRGGAVHEGGAGRVPPRADRADRARRAGAGGRQPLRGDRAVAADRGRRGRDPGRRPGGRGGAAGGARGVARRRATPRRSMPRWPSSRGWRPRTRTSCRATIAAARAGATTGEWAATLRDAFGSYRAPTGVGEAAAPAPGEEIAALREDVAALSESLGRTLKILVGKPGLDGHSNGAEQIAVRARDAGMEVVYEGIRLTPSQIARSAVDEGVHVIGLSILSGSHRELIPSVIAALREAGGGDIPLVVGGIIPDADVAPLRAAGVAAVYTPKDFELTRILRDVVAHRGRAERHRQRRRVSGDEGSDARSGPARARRDLVARAPGAALEPRREPLPAARADIAALLGAVSPAALGG